MTKSLLISVLFSAALLLFGQTDMTREQTGLIMASVFEVVKEKPAPGNISYEEELPLDQIPYLERTDEYQSIGTAFAVGPNLFFTAAHVCRLEAESLSNSLFLRDSEGQVYPFQNILKYDRQRDYVLFTALGMNNSLWLERKPNAQINDRVMAVGNAHGEGIIFRDGLLTSKTPEREKGEWKWLRYSAAASPGNSGGPLINSRGQVIGIVTAKSDNENLNYALPIEEAGDLEPAQGLLDLDITYMVPHFSARARMKEEYLFDLPQPYAPLGVELRRKMEEAYAKSLALLLKENDQEYFPRDREDSQRVLTETYASLFPLYITEKDDSTWQLTQPNEIETSDFGQGAYFKYGEMGGDTFWQLELSENEDISSYLKEPALLMDIFLKGKKITRNMGSEKIRITSMGAPIREEWFSDKWERPWQICIWNLPFADYKAILFTLPTPSGAVGMMSLVSSKSTFPFYQDFKAMADFIYVSFSAQFDQWERYLNQNYLPALFDNLNFKFNPGVSCLFESDSISLIYDTSLMEISTQSRMYLVPTFNEQGKEVIWDFSRLFFYEDFQGDNYFGLERIFNPYDKHDDEAMGDWNSLVMKEYPYEGKTILSKGDSYIYDRLNLTASKEDHRESNYLWSLQLGRRGEVDNDTMTALLSLLRNGFVLKEKEINAMIYNREIYHTGSPLIRVEGKNIFQAMVSSDRELLEHFLKEKIDLNAINDKEQTPLMTAIAQGDRKLTEDFIDLDVMVDNQDEEGKTPLMMLCEQEWEDLAINLMQKKTDLNLRDKYGRTALFYALSRGLNSAAEEMLDRGIMGGEKPEEGFTTFMAALEYSTHEICQELMNRGFYQKGVSDTGWTPVMIALRHGKNHIAGELIRKGGDIERVSSGGWSNLHLAVRYSSLENVVLLIEKGLDSEAVLPSGVGMTMLSYNNEEDKRITDYLLGLSLDLNHSKDNGWTDLMYALRYGTVEQARETYGRTDIKTGKTQQNWNPLMLALRNGKEELAESLLEDGNDVNCRSDEGVTPLSLAAEYSDPFTVELLVEKGAKVFSVNGENKSPLMIALREGNLLIADFLIEKDTPLNTLSSEGWNPLRYALRYASTGLVRKILDRGAEIDRGTTDSGWSDLHLAVRYKTAEIGRLIMEETNDINRKTDKGWTALHLAVTDNNSLIEDLLDRGAQIDSQNGNGDTPLHLALKNNMPYAVKILLQRGADPDIANFEGIRARDLAADKSKLIQDLFE